MPNKPAKADSAVTEKAGGFRFSDFFIIVFFLFIAFVSVNLFRLDLTRTINLKNVKPVGAVIIRQNIVQRRLADRVLWDRLANESPVYMGDLIRVADLSSAILQIEDSSVDLSENTLIRITRAADGKSLQIEMSEGNLSLSSAPDSGRISLDINGLQIQTVSGTVLAVKTEEKNIRLQVNEGTALFSMPSSGQEAALPRGSAAGSQQPEAGIMQEINAGSLVSFEVQPAAPVQGLPGENLSGISAPANTIVVVREAKTAAVIRPAANARFINNSRNPFTVNFSWNRNNFNDDELLRLEIAADRYFSRIITVREILDKQTEIAVDNGQWYWRLTYENTVYDEGRFSVTDGSGVRLQSPAVNSVFKFENELPIINYNWDEIAEASSYLLEISDTPDFAHHKIRRQSLVTFYSDSSLGEGTWYWRVMPVFPSVFTGSPAFSQISQFRVERYIPPQRTVIEAQSEEKKEISFSDWLASEFPSENISVYISDPESEARQNTETLSALASLSASEKEASLAALAETELSALSQAETGAASQVKTEPEPAPAAPVLRLRSPAQRANIAGLTALRQQTVFTWECEAQIVSSRFVLSKNANPFQGRPLNEIRNPSRTISVSSLGEGTYYWNVEAQTADGFTVRAAQNGIVQVLAIPLLSAPANLQPARGKHFTMNDLQAQRALNFSWQTVNGANAYIVTIFHQDAGGRRQILQTQPVTRAAYSLENLRILDAGTFIWQVEAVNRRSNGTIDQRGRIAEGTFVMDIFLPGSVKVEGAVVEE